MKKRILALALAGTTAFSVFGAAMSASAASTHTVAGNDAYTTYKQGDVDFSANKDLASEGYAADGQPALMPEYITKDEYTTIETNVSNDPSSAGVTFNKDVDGETYNVGTEDALVAWILNANPDPGTDPNVTHLKDIYKLLADAEDGHIYSSVVNGETHYHYFDNTVDAIDDYTLVDAGIFVGNPTGNMTEVIPITDRSVETAVRQYVLKGGTKAHRLLVLDYYDLDNLIKLSTQGDVDASGDLSTATLSRTGEVVSSGTIYVNDYWVDTNVISSYAKAFASAWGAADMRWNKDFDRYENKENASSLIKVLNAIDQAGTDDDEVTFEDSNLDPSFSGRYAVLQEFGEFLVEIGLADYYDGIYYGGVHINADLNGDGKVNYKDVDAFLAGYSYKYSGNDLYRFETLVDDIFDSIVYNSTSKTYAYTGYSSSNIVYLMQQYDKYVDGSFIDDEENGEDKWAQLLISALEAVDSTDFAVANQYTAFNRYRTSVINAYEDALTGSARMAAIKDLYNAVVSNNYRTPKADYTELNADIYSLYFNVNKMPTTYQAAVEYNDPNAVNILYGYADFDFVAGGKYGKFYNNTFNVKATYPLYPMSDYSELYNENVVYTGNKANSTYTGTTSTDEYEWFWNVYQLATTIANKSATSTAQGIVNTVNEALTAAVADLEVTSTATAAMNGVLEEVIDNYTEATNPTRVKEEADYVAKYWTVYQQGLDYAEIAEGKAQNTYAIEIASLTGNTLAYDSAQISVTKGMIADLNKKITEGKNALTALKNDKDNYNAAQTIALNNSISAAENLVKLYNGTLYTNSIYARYQSENTKFSTLKGDKDQITISDLTAAEAAIDDAINFKNVIQGWSKNEAGKWMYGTEDSYLNNGWNKIGSVWYYFNEDGTAKQSEWMQEDGKWYWFNSNAGAAIGWAKVDGQWYYFGGNNAMKTGWQKVDGSWYYLASSGRMITGWAQVDGKWYYMSKESNSLGQMLANTTTPDGYKVGADGAMLTK